MLGRETSFGSRVLEIFGSAEMRRSYKAVWNVLLEENLPTRNPVDLFDRWFTEAKDSSKGYLFISILVAILYALSGKRFFTSHS